MRPINTILAIDTSCDETSVAVTWQRRVLANVMASQVELHKKYGGVFPTEAKRAHEEKIDHVVEEAVGRAVANMRRLRSDPTQPPLEKGRSAPLLLKEGMGVVGFMEEVVEAIAVTYGPGLAPALEVGILKAKELAKKYGKPLITVNHLEGHLLSCLAENSRGKGSDVEDDIAESNFLVLGILVSGAHTELVKVNRIGDYEVLGQTLDDAAGEVFDKVGRMLGIGYPAGEFIEKLAKDGDSLAYDFPIPMSRHTGLDFSFSGIKTAVLYKVRELTSSSHHFPRGETTSGLRNIQMGQSEGLTRKQTEDLAASFQRVVIRSIILKLKRCLDSYEFKSVWLGGGVAANFALRSEIRKVLKKYGLKLYIPYSEKLYMDNAAMIGVAGYFKALRSEFVEDLDELERVPGLDL